MQQDHTDNPKDLIQQLKQQLHDKDHIINKLQSENEGLREKLQKLLQERYGKKSEKLADEELPVLDEAAVTPEEATVIAQAEAEIAIAAHARTKPKRKPLPADFPREVVIHELSLEQQVCTCGHQLHCIGEDSNEKLDYIPAQIKVIHTIRKKYGCRNCEFGVKSAAMPPDFLPKSIAAPGLLSHVALSKYEDHCPLYRQENIWQRIGVDIPRSTLCNWVLMTAERLQIFIPLMQEELISLDYARADETPVQVMEENKVRTSKRAYMWVFTTGRKTKAIIIYKFAMTRAGSIAEGFFAGFAGFLQTDAFAGYNALGKTDNVTSVGCMAHARRKFVAIVKTTQKTGAAHYAVAIIAKLYKIETEIKTQNFDFAQIKDYRQQHAKPILLEFKNWLTTKQKQAPPKSTLGQAIHYFTAHWDALVVYLAYGFLDIDNNFAEQQIRPFAVGRKNWLFMGNERGGEAAATFFTLISSAKANGLNTYAYFRCLMTEMPNIDPENKEALLALLPHRIDPAILQKYLI